MYTYNELLDVEELLLCHIEFVRMRFNYTLDQAQQYPQKIFEGEKKNVGTFVARQEVSFPPQSPFGMLRSLHKVWYSRNTKVKLLTLLDGIYMKDVKMSLEWQEFSDS